MITRDLGLVDYTPVHNKMQQFTLQRDAETPDELWLLEHKPVFTQGHNGQDEHLLVTSDIPVVKTDRGGQITYHGPGQVIAYTLFDLRRRHIGVRDMVTRLENSVIAILNSYDIDAMARHDAPGVYVEGRKIASLGLRVKRGACYHGISFNIDMDLTPFNDINPCGYAGMEVIDLKAMGHTISIDMAKQQLASAIEQQMLQGEI